MKFWKWLDARDIAALIGLCMLSSGLYLVWPPAALIAPGAILIWKSMHGNSKSD